MRDLLPFVDAVWRPYLAGRGASPFLHDVGDPTVAGRIRRPAGPYDQVIGADRRVVFPEPLLTLGLHPARDLATALARAYARWLTEVHLPAHPEDRGMLVLPIDDVDACRVLVEEFGEREGVAGVFVTGVGFPEMVDNRYVGLYAGLQERRLVLAFHPHPVWREPPYEIFDRYLPVWALGYPFSQCALLVNWLIHGMPERFPELRCVSFEAGVAWIAFIAHRFDQEFLKRQLEAPLLRERPSHYLGRWHYGTQPVDQVGDTRLLEPSFRLVGADRWLYASAFPQWDFDAPVAVERLGFLSVTERDDVLAGNGARLFGFEIPEPARAGGGEGAGRAGDVRGV